MRHGSLFSGIGGFDLAAEWMGWENVFHCEWNEFGQKILKYYWPKAISYNDITKTDFTIHRGQIDILTGGFPCQPASTAGKRKGTDDDRWLWPEMLRAIREIQPSWVVAENVRGLLSLEGGVVFDTVLADLEAEGYEVIPFLLPACAVNAPHRRDRIWIVAHSPRLRSDRAQEHEDGNRQGRERGGCYINNDGQIWRPTPDTGNKGLQGCEVNGSTRGIRQNGYKFPAGCLRPGWENFPTQSPLCERNDGLPVSLAGITVSKHRKESIKAFGNAIVPQVAYEIFKAIENGRL